VGSPDVRGEANINTFSQSAGLAMRWLLNILPDIFLAFVLMALGILGAICVLSIAVRFLRWGQ